jgi:glycosyltransferase involved in cell wall biosynthesis
MIHEKFPHYFSHRDTTRKNKARAVHSAHHIICVSENTRRDLIELLNVPQEKTSVVYHGYSISCAIDSVKPANREKPFILYVGSRCRYKNFDLLLRAFASSKLLRNEFSIICFGGGKASAREKALLNTLDLPSDCVKYIDGNDPVLAGLYASAKMFVYPSLYEGFGIPPLEAMAFGCPVVCSNTSSIPEVVGDAAHLFDPANTSDLQAAMEAVVCSSAYAARLKSKGYERIKLFSWKKCADDTLGVYEKLLGMKR